MIRINLLTEAKAAAAKKKAPILPTGARLNNLLFIGGFALPLVLIGATALILGATRRNLDEEIGKARVEAERLRSIIEEVQAYEAKKASLEAKIQLINDLKTNQKGPVRLMDELSRALPDLVWLSELQMSGNQVTLKGRTLSPNAVATYLENLKKSPFFAEPVFRNLGQEAGGQGIYAWEMTLTFTPGAALGTGTVPAGAASPAPPGASPAPPAGGAGT
ncbi:MAG: PilN domain-containing protein [Thermoanaerobaculia bacterium]